MEQETLLKLLVASGLGSRRQISEAIRQARVKVNGEIIENFSYPVNHVKDIILIDGKPVQTKPQQKIVLILNKPAGILSTTHDDRGRKTIIDILPQKYRNIMLYPVGRLDKDSTGLLLITNDGELTYQLTHPKFGHEKEYLVAIKGKLRIDEISSIQKGIHLNDGITSPATITEITTSPSYNYSITIHEGRNRQIHRMFAKLGHIVLALKRVRVGKLRLGDIKEGTIRELSNTEIVRLLQT
jgi:23S rRNA pseudouridine2605 synthase